MKITVIYVTDRAGGIDVLADALSVQQPLPDLSWDLVVVDGLPGRVERGLAAQHLRNKRLPLVHYGSPMPAMYPLACSSFASMANTGLLHATGDHVVFVRDFTWFKPEVIGQWQLAYEQRKDSDKMLMCAVGIEYQAPIKDNNDDVITWVGKSGDPRIDGRWNPTKPVVPVLFDVDFFCAPTSYFELTNGIDPRADLNPDWVRSSIVAQANFHGYHLFCERRIIYHAVERPTVSDDDADEPSWTDWSANPYNVSQVRKRLRSGKE